MRKEGSDSKLGERKKGSEKSRETVESLTHPCKMVENAHSCRVLVTISSIMSLIFPLPVNQEEFLAIMTGDT